MHRLFRRLSYFIAKPIGKLPPRFPTHEHFGIPCCFYSPKRSQSHLTSYLAIRTGVKSNVLTVLKTPWDAMVSTLNTENKKEWRGVLANDYQRLLLVVEELGFTCGFDRAQITEVRTVIEALWNPAFSKVHGKNGGMARVPNFHDLAVRLNLTLSGLFQKATALALDDVKQCACAMPAGAEVALIKGLAERIEARKQYADEQERGSIQISWEQNPDIEGSFSINLAVGSGDELVTLAPFQLDSSSSSSRVIKINPRIIVEMLTMAGFEQVEFDNRHGSLVDGLKKITAKTPMAALCDQLNQAGDSTCHRR